MFIKLKKLQRRACKLILGKDYTTLEAALNQLHKIATNAAPIYLRSNESNVNYSQLNL